LYRLSDNGTCDGGRRRQQCRRSAVLACRARVPRSYTTTIWRAAASDRAIYSGWLVSGARARVCALADARVMCVRAVDADHENNNNKKKNLLGSVNGGGGGDKEWDGDDDDVDEDEESECTHIIIIIYIYSTYIPV